MNATDIAGITLPDSRIARAITQLIRDTESDLLFHHSTRVYWWGALAGNKLGLAFDPELLYAAAMFHDIGITPHYDGSPTFGTFNDDFLAFEDPHFQRGNPCTILLNPRWGR